MLEPSYVCTGLQKEPSTGNILENIESTAIVAQKNGCGLVVLNTESDLILGSRKDMSLFEFIKEHRISLGISCSKGKFSPAIAYEIIEKKQHFVWAICMMYWKWLHTAVRDFIVFWLDN